MNPTPVTMEVVDDLPATAVVVSAPMPTSPVVVVEAAIVEEIARLEVAARALAVTDKATADAASILLRETQASLKAIEHARVAVKQPFLDLSRKIDDAARQPAQRLAAAKDAVQKKLTAFIVAEEEKQRKAREKMERERREAEEQRAREAAEAARKAAEAGNMVDIDIPADEPAKPAPVALPARVAPAGVSVVHYLEVEVVAIAQVPEQWLKPRELALVRVQDAFCRGWVKGAALPQVPGLRFVEKTRTVAR